MAEYGIERLSKDPQLRGINVAIQREEIEQAAARAGVAIAEHFSDNDRSASSFATKSRPRYDDLKATLLRSNNQEDAIWLTEIARLTRETKEALFFIDLSRTRSLRYIKFTNGMTFDLHTEWGRTAFREAVSRAESESDRSSERQHRKKNWQAEGGAYHGGQRPWGYEGAKYEVLRDIHGEILKDDKGRPVKGRLLNPGRVGTAIIEDERAIRIEGTQRFIAGEREMDLVRNFNKRGIPAPEGGPWRIGNTKRAFTNKRAVAFKEFPGPGTRTHRGREYPAIWPAIISKEDYNLMMAAFKLRSQKVATGESRYQYLLSGKLRCTHDGHGPMYGKGRHDRHGKYEARYGCRSQNERGEKLKGPKTYRKAGPVDHWVREAVIEALDIPALATAFAPEENQQRLSELVELHTKQTLHLQQLIVDYGAGLLTRDELPIAKHAAQTALDATEEELSKLQARQVTRILPAGQSLRDFMSQASTAIQRQIIDLVIDYVIVKPSHPHRSKNADPLDRDDLEIVWKV